MIRDPGPQRNLGFGILSRDLPSQDDQQGVDQSSSFIAQRLADDPILRFFAVGAATLVGMHVAGELIKKGGLKLSRNLLESEKSIIPKNVRTTLIDDFRSVRDTMDDWEGVTRKDDPANPESLFGSIGISHSGFAFQKGDKVAQWSMRDEVQQRLVRQARRLPYELPAAYLAQRLPGVGTDAIFGSDQESPNWSSPTDVISDFANQSAKNLAGYLIPFDAGGAVIKQGWRKILDYGDGIANPQMQNAAKNLGFSLNLVGHKSSEILADLARASQKGIAGFSQGIDNAVKHTKPLPFHFRDVFRSEEQRSAREVAKGVKAEDVFDVGVQGALAGWRRVSRPLRAPKHFLAGRRTGLAQFDENWEHLQALRSGKRPGIDTIDIKGRQVLLDASKAAKVSRQSTVEEIASTIIHYGGTSADYPTLESMRGSKFYEQQMDDAYKNIIVDQMAQHDLIRSGDIPREEIADFVQKLTMRRRPTLGIDNTEIPLSERINFGKDTVLGGNSDAHWAGALADATGHMKHGRTLSRALPDVIRGRAGPGVDDLFLEQQENLEVRTFEQWRTLYKGIVDFSSRKLGQSRIPFEQFENLQDEDALDFLVRNTANQINRSAGRPVIPLRGQREIGNFRSSFEELSQRVGQFGFSPDDPGRMRDFLVQQKVISAPGTHRGFNVFGMRALSIEDALNGPAGSKARGFFGGDPTREYAVRRLAENMADANEISTADWLRRTPMGGVIETRSGEIIDLSPITSAFRRGLNKFADSFQIPFIGLKPLQVGFFGVQREAAETPIFQIAGGGTRQPFTGETEKQADAWLFTREKGGRGSLQRLTTEGRKSSLTRLDGWFKSWGTDASSMTGRAGRLAIGDKGQAVEQPRSRMQRLFNVDEDQPQSLKRLWNRFKGRSTDLRNPAVLSQAILDNNGNIAKIAQNAGVSKTEVASAFRNLERYLRQFQLKPDAIRGILDSSDERLKGLFRVADPVTGATRNLDEITSGSDVENVIKGINRLISEEFDDDKRKTLARASSAFLESHRKGSLVPGYFDQASSQGLRKRGIHTRLEEAQADIGRFLAVAKGIEEGSFQGVAQDLLGEVDKLKRAGKITGGDYSEARAAVLGLQVSFQKIMQYDMRQGEQARILDVLTSSTNARSAREVLKDVAEYRTEGGIVGAIKRPFKKRFAVSDYEYPGSEYNPYSGGQEAVFVPTFGTTLGRSTGPEGFSPARAVRAIGSVAQVNNWNDPDNFSTASLYGGHMFQRLNNFLSIAGVQLDESAYAGGLDYYARGLVGQRVLPAVAVGATVLAADRTAGGVVNERDEEGNRVYSPLVLGAAAGGVAEAQAAMAGIIPGGQDREEKRRELYEGEVAVRKGRWWPLGSTPWEGGRVSYFRPSWYRRFTSGAGYVPEAGFDSPLEKLAFGYDFSPLRPLDPYRFERQTHDTRPYPVTGQYFNGPWGPLTSALNMTVGRALKPERTMHEDQVNYYLSQAQLVGAAGVAPDQSVGTPLIGLSGGIGTGGAIGRSAGVGAVAGSGSGIGTGTGAGFGRPGGGRSSGGSATESQQTLAILNQAYTDVATSYPGTNSPYGMTVAPGAFPPQIITGGTPMTPGSTGYQAGQLGYQLQELAGIYGFAFGAARSALGMGDQDMNPTRPVLESPTGATSIGRAFWENNLGGLGDMPLPIEGDYANLELSEFVRRFVTRERSGVNEINPIPNQLGVQNSWLPGSEYFINFRQGDPYAAVPEGLSRLPGTGYERYNPLHSDETGRYGVIDQHKILGDVAPWSAQYRQIDRQVDNYIRSPQDRSIVNRTRYQVAEKQKEFDFKPYQYNNTDYETITARVNAVDRFGNLITDQFQNPVALAGVIPNGSYESDQALQDLVGQEVNVTYDRNVPILATDRDEPIAAMIARGGSNLNRSLLHQGLADESGEDAGLLNADEPTPVRNLKRLFEMAGHRDTYFNTKFAPNRTAAEDWERRNVYGATFPQWQNPIKDYLMPSVYKATERNPLLSGLALGTVGALFGANPKAKAIGGLIGSLVGVSAGLLRSSEESLQGERFIPKHRKQEVAVEEYVDILTYVKNMRLRAQAISAGNMQAASNYTSEAKRTMYGADLYVDPEQIMGALPERKRKHFMEMIHAPISERNRILTTAGRLERRIYEAAWGMDVEARPDLPEYFADRELPGENWEGWDPDVNMEHVKIKVAQNIGLDVSQMGYYPQQVQAANAVNPSFPDITSGSGSQASVEAQLRKLMYAQNINGNIRTIPTPYPGTKVQLHAGVA